MKKYKITISLEIDEATFTKFIWELWSFLNDLMIKSSNPNGVLKDAVINTEEVKEEVTA
jgi:hypothetical protein